MKVKSRLTHPYPVVACGMHISLERLRDCHAPVFFIELVREDFIGVVGFLCGEEFVNAWIGSAKLISGIEQLVGKVVRPVEAQSQINELACRFLQDLTLAFVELLIEVQDIGEHILPGVIQRRDVVFVDDSNRDIDQVGPIAFTIVRNPSTN